jgi:hypothetical protein
MRNNVVCLGASTEEVQNRLGSVVMGIRYSRISNYEGVGSSGTILGSSYSNSGPGATSRIVRASGDCICSGRVFNIRSWYDNRISNSIALRMNARLGCWSVNAKSGILQSVQSITLSDTVRTELTILSTPTETRSCSCERRTTQQIYGKPRHLAHPRDYCRVYELTCRPPDLLWRVIIYTIPL